MCFLHFHNASQHLQYLNRDDPNGIWVLCWFFRYYICRMDRFKTMSRFDDLISRHKYIIPLLYFNFQLLCHFQVGMIRHSRHSNPFPAKIGLRMQRWYVERLKVSGTPLNSKLKSVCFAFWLNRQKLFGDLFVPWANHNL